MVLVTVVTDRPKLTAMILLIVKPYYLIIRRF